MKKILIVFFFIYTSLFASNVSPYEGYTAFTASGGRFLHNDDIVSSDGHCDSTNCSELYNYCDGSGQPPSSNYYIVSNGQISLYDTHYDSTRSSGQRVCLEKHTIYTLLDSCPTDTVFDPDTQHCVSPPPPSCSDKEYLDASTNTCVTASFPSGFPTSDNKGTPKIVSDNTSEDSCIPGTKVYSGIAYAVVIGWDSAKNKCVWSAFFCNNGLTWDNLQQTCVVPADTANFAPDNNDSLSNTNTISPELASACTSGSWAKTWTVDYCSTPSPCYIGLDLQDYNLNCGSKYIEYECTSDYRIKKFVQVSCGDISKDDYDNVNLDISSPDTNDVVPDSSTDTSSTDVASIITAQSNLINNNLDGLISSSKDINKNIDDVKSKLDDIKNSIDSLKEEINPQTDADNSSLDSHVSAVEGFFNDSQNSIDTIVSNFNDTRNLINSGFTYSIPHGTCVDPSTSVFGHTITLSICEPFSTFKPFFYFFTTIALTFVVIKIFILGFSL